MLKYYGPTVLYQHLISQDASVGEPGATTWPLILTVTHGDGDYTVWMTFGNTPRRVFSTALGSTARCVYDDIKRMPFAMAMHHWIEAG